MRQTKWQILDGMSFSWHYIPDDFSREELAALKEVSLNWDASNSELLLEIVGKVRFCN